MDRLQQLCPHLRPFLVKIQEDSISPWSDEDLAVIASTLTRSPQKWKVSDAQTKIYILGRKPFPPSQYASDLQKRIDTFEEIVSCDPSTVLRTVTADELLPITKKLNIIPKWTVKNTEFAHPSLTGIAFVLSEGCSAEGLNEFQMFQGRWFSFLDEHPVIMGKVDPWFVVMQTPPPPGGYPPPTHQIGHNISLPTNHANTNGQVVSFASQIAAGHYQGQLTNHGIHAVIFNAPFFYH